jgi:hypothetical protein
MSAQEGELIRKLHLDFHTPAHTPAVASLLEPARFARTLRDSHITDVVLFAKDQYGLCYFPTENGQVHPHLERRRFLPDLVGACRSEGVRVQAYFTLGLSTVEAQRHPDWLQRRADGSYHSWSADKFLFDFASPYVDQLVVPQVQEVLDCTPGLSGFWFDIFLYHQFAYYSRWIDELARRAVSEGTADSPSLRRTLAQQTLDRVASQLNTVIATRIDRPDNFYNSLICAGDASRAHLVGQCEVECPPLFVDTDTPGVLPRHQLDYGQKPIVLTSRFEQPWGDIGSLRTFDQLRYDTACALAAGADLSIGDHLHPAGQLDAAVYERIAAVYQHAAGLAPWTDNASPLVELMVLTPIDRSSESTLGEIPAPAKAIFRQLLELGVQASIRAIDDRRELPSTVRCVCIADERPLEPETQQCVRHCVARGVHVVLLGQAVRGLEDLAGVRDVTSTARPAPGGAWGDFVRLPAGLIATSIFDQVVPLAFACAEAKDSTLASLPHVAPMLPDRAPDSSASNPPAAGRPTSHVALTRYNQVTWCGLPLANLIHQFGHAVWRSILDRLLDTALPHRLLRHTAGPTVECSLHTHPSGHLLHIVHHAADRRGQRRLFPSVAPALASFSVTLPIDSPVRVVRLPDQSPVVHRSENGLVTIEVPPFAVHQVLFLASTT